MHCYPMQREEVKVENARVLKNLEGQEFRARKERKEETILFERHVFEGKGGC